MIAAAMMLIVLAQPSYEFDSDTTIRTYEVTSTTGESVLFTPMSQALRFGATQPIHRGEVSFETYFRGITDPQSSESDLATRVYLAQARVKRGKRVPISLQVGRQYALGASDFYAFDGVRFSLGTPRYFGFEVLGGAKVTDESTDVSHSDETLLGAAIYSRGVQNMQGRVAYRRTHVRAGAPIREDFTLDGSRRAWDSIWFYGNAVTSLITADINEALLGTSVPVPLRSGIADFEFFRYRPDFGADSIFNVFQTEAYHEGRVRLRFPLLFRPGWVFVRAGAQLYRGDPDVPDTSTVGSIGFRTATLFGHAGLQTTVATGYGGDRYGMSGELGTRLSDDRVSVLTSAHLVNSSNELLTTANGIAGAFVVAGRVALTKAAELTLQGEQHVSRVESPSLRVSVNLFMRWSTAEQAGRGSRMRRQGVVQ